MEYNIRLSNGQVLNGLIRSPGQNLRAVVILVHGLGEHIQRYSHWADLFLAERIAFTGVDLPGHGKTDGKRGNIRNFSVLHEMLDVMINECKKTFPGIPVFLYGHSLGGLIVLDYLLKRKPSIKGAIVTSPPIRLAFEPDKRKQQLAAVMKLIFPGLVQSSGLEVNFLSHDERVVANYKNDPLVHDKISVSLFNIMMKGSKDVLSFAEELNLPLLLVHGAEDKISSPVGSMDFAKKTRMAELKIWDGGYHELHNEPFKNEVFTYIKNWIAKKIG